jgi:hypothetical protein
LLQCNLIRNGSASEAKSCNFPRVEQKAVMTLRGKSMMQQSSVLRRRPIYVSDLLGLLAAVALLIALVDPTQAQSRPDPNAIKTIGTCVTKPVFVMVGACTS